MKHKIVQKKILRYIDGDISEKERQEIESHLQHCKSCRKDVELLSGVWDSSQLLNRARPSPFLWNKISTRLAGKNRKGRVSNMLWLFIRQAARPVFTVVIVLLGLFIGFRIGGRLIKQKPSKQQNYITTAQMDNEFGLNNFQLLSSGSLDSKMAELMEYAKK